MLVSKKAVGAGFTLIYRLLPLIYITSSAFQSTGDTSIPTAIGQNQHVYTGENMAKCVSCYWFDEGECIKTGKIIRFPNRVRVCNSYNRIPEIAINYYTSVSSFAELTDEMLHSKPFKNLLRKLVKEKKI